MKNKIDEFLRIMSQFDQLNENDIDYEAENIYNEILNVPQKETTVEINPTVHNLQKSYSHHSKPPRLQCETVSVSDADIPLKSDSQGPIDFYKAFSELAADYAKSWVQNAHEENRRKVLVASNISYSDNNSSPDISQSVQNIRENIQPQTLSSETVSSSDSKSLILYNRYENKEKNIKTISSSNDSSYRQKMQENQRIHKDDSFKHNLTVREFEVNTESSSVESSTTDKMITVKPKQIQVQSEIITLPPEKQTPSTLALNVLPDKENMPMKCHANNLLHMEQKEKSRIVRKNEKPKENPVNNKPNRKRSRPLKTKSKNIKQRKQEPELNLNQKIELPSLSIKDYSDRTLRKVPNHSKSTNKLQDTSLNDNLRLERNDIDPPPFNKPTEIRSESNQQKASQNVVNNDNLKHLIQAVLSSKDLGDQYKSAMTQIQQVNDTILNTTQQVAQNQNVIKDIQNQHQFMYEQQKVLHDALKEIREVSQLNADVERMRESQQKQENTDSENLKAKIESLQMDHDIRLNQIHSSIAIAEIKAKSQAYNIQTQYDLGLGKLKLDEWKTNLQTNMQRDTMLVNQSHEYNLMKMKAELEIEKQKQRDWYTTQEAERERLFKKELLDNKHQQEAQFQNIDRQYRQFELQQRQEHEGRLKQQSEQFSIDIEKLRNEQSLFHEERKRDFLRQTDIDRQNYEINMLKFKEDFNRERDERTQKSNELVQHREQTFQRQMECDKQNFSIDMTKIKQEFAERLHRNKELSDFELLHRKQQFAIDVEERKLQSAHLLAEHKGDIEKYKADLIVQVKNRQIDKQDENEKLKLQLKMAEYELKLQDASLKSASNKFQFRSVPTAITTFEFQMEKSADTAPHSIVRSFEQLWNLQYDQTLDRNRLLKHKKELISMAKKVVENYSVFSSYLTHDLTDSHLSTRLNYCDYFKRPGVFLFKTGGYFHFTEHHLSSAHLLELQKRSNENSDPVEFSVPRYCLTSDGLRLVDMLEYMDKVLLFPLNASYNVDLSSNRKILHGDQILFCPDIIRDIFYYGSSVHEPAFNSSVNTRTRSSIVPHKRSTPIYVSDNYIVLPQFRRQNVNQATKIQIFT